jgi:hypothetical protein
LLSNDAYNICVSLKRVSLVALYIQPVRVYMWFLVFYFKSVYWAMIGPVAVLDEPTHAG